MEIAITANKRTVKGKAAAKLRKTGKLPGVLYGHNLSNAEIEIDEREFLKVFRAAGESTLVKLTYEGKTQPVLIQEVQRHFLHGQPIHVDFYAVNMTEKLKANIPLHFVGESQAVKALGGTLVKNLSEIEVECLPGDLPHEFEVDISALNTFEDDIHVSDLKVSDKVEVLTPGDEVVATVTAPRSEEEMASLSEKPVVEDVSKVEGVVKPEAPGEENKTEEAKTKE
ncbi:MAG TPA: 50S ribosomal protein L25/general stress protein Ctc [Patescibacteria group bacterium]|nr:50S ribosomal protein L25/general stress protein Ctc [Patescibacteria group bacterium]